MAKLRVIHMPGRRGHRGWLRTLKRERLTGNYIVPRSVGGSRIYGKSMKSARKKMRKRAIMTTQLNERFGPLG